VGQSRRGVPKPKGLVGRAETASTKFGNAMCARPLRRAKCQDAISLSVAAGTDVRSSAPRQPASEIARSPRARLGTDRPARFRCGPLQCKLAAAAASSQTGSDVGDRAADPRRLSGGSRSTARLRRRKPSQCC
jgi:hypothetical protein